MKVEKCPRCGKTDMVYVRKIQNYPIRYWVVGCKEGRVLCDNLNEFRSIFRFVAILRYNRWARREAKRIAKEGETK